MVEAQDLQLATMPEVGIPLGVLIGLISGVTFLKFLGTLRDAVGLQAVLPIAAELFALPVFWFGGQWIPTEMINAVELSQIISSYVGALAVTFTLMSIIPLSRYVIRMGNEIGGARAH